MKKHPRVPLPATADIVGTERVIQVNHCRAPNCENYGIPARHQHGKTGPSADRDMHYKVHSTKRGKVPSIRCKACTDNPPVKSNESIVREIERLSDANGVWLLEESASCANEGCDNHGKTIAAHKKAYRKRGKPDSGNGQYYQCKSCGRKTLVSNPTRLHDDHRRLASDVLSRIANKSPLRGSGRGVELKSMNSYYSIINFIHNRCRAHSGAVDRALIDGRLTLPHDLTVETDGQEYTLNWISRLDRRNVVLSGYCTVDADSRFILGIHANFDGRVDPFEINYESVNNGDLDLAEPFRKHAHYWLAGDELGSGRAMGRELNKISKHAPVALIEQIKALYAAAESRKDVEDIELQYRDKTFCQLPPLSSGMQVHEPYTAYAHWMLLHRILTGAGVERLQANMDQNSMTRAAFLCAYVDEVRRGDADAFFVHYTKYQTVDERERILLAAKKERKQFRLRLPEDVRYNYKEVARRMMQVRIEERQPIGKWQDEWIEHPLPTMNEPHKAMTWLTARDDIDDTRKADMYLNAGLARIDNVFMMSRRLFSSLERPIGTSSGYNTVWHGYAPYNPRMLEKYLTIFRSMNNFVFVGDDGKTPAMRLGFAKQPLTYDDILWPGQRIPQRKRRRRKGKVIPGLRRVA